jgi:hypothetical protein
MASVNIQGMEWQRERERDRESELGFGEAHGFTSRRDWRYSNVLNVLEGSFVENLGNAAAPGTNIT